MSWPRLRTWVGEHPLWTVGGATAAATVPGIVIFGCLSHGVLPDPPGGWFFLGSLLLILLTAGAVTFLAGCLLGRSGRRVNRLMWLCVWTPVVAFPLATVGTASYDNWPAPWNAESLAETYDWFFWSWASGIWMALAAFLCLPQLAGWGLAALVTRWQVRRGKWLPVAPVGPKADERSTAVWVVRHPVWASSLAGLLCLAGGIALQTLLRVFWMRDSAIDPVLPWMRVVTAAALVAVILYIGCALGRAGRRPSWALACLPVTVVVVAGALWLYMTACEAFPEDFDLGGKIVAGVTWVAGCVLGGTIGAEGITFIQYRRRKWPARAVADDVPPAAASKTA